MINADVVDRILRMVLFDIELDSLKDLYDRQVKHYGLTGDYWGLCKEHMAHYVIQNGTKLCPIDPYGPFEDIITSQVYYKSLNKKHYKEVA